MIDFKKLAEPIPHDKVKTRTVGGGRKAAYITARTVMNRLDDVVGPDNWRDEYVPLGNGAVLCTLYLRVDGEWIGKSDVGTENNTEPIKSTFSDALKRAAVRWGIGRELYQDGTAFEDDDDPPAQPAPKLPDRRIPTPPAEPSEPAGELDAVTWTRDKGRTAKLVHKAGDVWNMAAGVHLYNRVAVALNLPSANYTRREMLQDAIAEHYAGTPEAAWDAIKTYQETEPEPA